MVKTIKEFQDELRVLREEMYDYGETADSELVASWLDRLVISLDKLCVNLDIMAVEVETMAKRPARAAVVRRPARKAKKTAKKRTAKKKKTAKKKVVRKKRRR
jgi:hypothetical protein